MAIAVSATVQAFSHSLTRLYIIIMNNSKNLQKIPNANKLIIQHLKLGEIIHSALHEYNTIRNIKLFCQIGKT